MSPGHCLPFSRGFRNRFWQNARKPGGNIAVIKRKRSHGAIFRIFGIHPGKCVFWDLGNFRRGFRLKSKSSRVYLLVTSSNRCFCRGNVELEEEVKLNDNDKKKGGGRWKESSSTVLLQWKYFLSYICNSPFVIL